MQIKGYPIKKRYVALGVLVLIGLYSCSGKDDPPRQVQASPAPVSVDSMPTQSFSGDVQPQVIQQQPPVVVVNSDRGSNDGFFQGFMMSHMMHAIGSGNTGSSQTNTRRTVVNKTTIVNNYGKSAPIATTSLNAGPRSAASQGTYYGRKPSTAITPAPAPSRMQARTWATSTSKGWGSTSSYKSRSTSYSVGRSRRR